LLVALALGLRAVFATSIDTAGNQPLRQRPTIVLVHGAWEDASSSDKLAKLRRVIRVKQLTRLRLPRAARWHRALQHIHLSKAAS
jgi:hypothetical protein